jgi:N-ethylmaleimide reductase
MDRPRLAGIRRSSSAQAEWLSGIARIARNAQLFRIIIHADIPDMSQTKLFEPFKLGPITLPNRLAMAPLTRNRAVPPAWCRARWRSTITASAPPQAC